MDKPVLDSTTILCQLDALLQNYRDLKKKASTENYYIYNSGAIDALQKLRWKITGNQ